MYAFLVVFQILLVTVGAATIDTEKGLRTGVSPFVN